MLTSLVVDQRNYRPDEALGPYQTPLWRPVMGTLVSDIMVYSSDSRSAWALDLAASS